MSGYPLPYPDGPPLLLVSKSIRQEALPVFAQSIVYVAVNSSGPFKIPSAWMTHTKEVHLQHRNSTLPDEHTMPNLEELRICLYLNEPECIVRGADEEELCKDVVAQVKSSFEGSHRHVEVEKRRSGEGKLPFKVLLDPDVLWCEGWGSDEDDSVVCWGGVLIDWKKKRPSRAGLLTGQRSRGSIRTATLKTRSCHPPQRELKRKARSILWQSETAQHEISAIQKPSAFIFQ